jgi:putative DNA primase/helicase
MQPDPFADADFAEVEEPPKSKSKSRTRQKAKANGHAHEAPPPPGAIVIDPSAPYRIAKEYLARDFTYNEKRTLHYHRGGFYGWSGQAYPGVTDADIRAGLYRYLDQCVALDKGGMRPIKPNQAMVGNVLDALRAAAHLDDSTSPPTWLEYLVDLPAEEIVSCYNGLLHLPTLTVLPHTPAFYTYNALDFGFDPGAPEPQQWLAFLKQLWPNDQATIDTLQELFGLALTGDTRHQKAFLMVGPKRSGKGTIARILTRLIGTENTVAPTLADLGTNFGLAPLIGKRMAIISDARLGGRADQQAIAERLLSITGEDTITVDRKYMPAWTGRLEVRFLILSNELPRLVDASGALVSRFIVLMLTNSFYGKEDHGLTDRLLMEMPGILNWAIAGWQRLYMRGYFQQPKSAAEAVQDLEDLGSPISAFLRAACVVEPGRVVEISRLYEVWAGWSKEQGRERPGTAQTFGRDLRAAVPGIRVVNPRDEYDKRHRQYEGIGLK